MSLFHLQIFLCTCFHDNKKMIFCSHTSHSGISSFWFAFRIKFSFWYEISCNLKKNYLQNWKLQIVLSGVSGMSENVLSEAVWFFHLNAVQTLFYLFIFICHTNYKKYRKRRTSLWNKSHSWRKVIPVSYKQLLRSHGKCKLEEDLYCK